MTDPVTLAVVRGALEQIADEMDPHLIHVDGAIAPIISETSDRTRRGSVVEAA